LAVRPTHAVGYLEGFVFQRVFRSTSDDAFDTAARKARAECLTDANVRSRWRRALERAILYMRSFEGEQPTWRTDGSMNSRG
jgi:hypothetical protein